MNKLLISACVIELDVIRYTPAGLAIIELVLEHLSEVFEAGQKRTVQLQLKARAMGKMAHELSRLPLNSFVEVEGFLAHTYRNSTQVCLHILSYRLR